MQRIISMLSIAIITIVLAALLSGCGPSTRETVGLVGGGVAGGAIGSAVTRGSTVGTVAGAVGGAALGHTIARQTR